MTATNDVASWLSALRQQLTGTSATAPLDAQVVMAHVLGMPRAWVLAHPEARLEEAQVARLAEAKQRLAQGEPLPYVLGHWEFFGLDFTVTPDVLIPRPETELLVETALNWLEEHLNIHTAVDIGTGSGCIAISLAARRPALAVFAGDLSFNALQVARKNAALHGVTGRVHFFQGDLLTPLHGPLPLVCANLPYIPSHTLAGLPVADFEPRLALDGGPDGLAAIRKLIGDAPRLLARGGLCLLEIEANQGPAVIALARSAFPGAEIHLRQDLNELDRLLSIANN